MSHLASLLVTLGAASLLAVALGVRERSAGAALKLSLAGGLVLVGPLSHFVPLGELAVARPLLPVASVGLAVWAMFSLADEVNPKGPRLPPGVEALRASGPGASLVLRSVYAVFAAIAVVVSSRFLGARDVWVVMFGVVGAILGGHFLNQRGSPAVWVLDRHPESVAWVYVAQLTLINRRYGTRSVHWRAILGLNDGQRLVLPAGSQLGAEQLAAEVATLCPGASVGHTTELEAKFRTSPASLRRG